MKGLESPIMKSQIIITLTVTNSSNDTGSVLHISHEGDAPA